MTQTTIDDAARRVAEAASKAERFRRDVDAAHSDSGLGVRIHAERADYDLSRAVQAYESAKRAAKARTA